MPALVLIECFESEQNENQFAASPLPAPYLTSDEIGVPPKPRLAPAAQDAISWPKGNGLIHYLGKSMEPVHSTGK
jgi:hypothetical protein